MCLLEDLTANIAFALETIENEQIRREAEKEIAEKNNFIKTVTDSLPGLVAYWTRDLRCTFANHGYQEWFGKTESEMVGIHVRDLLGEEIFAKSVPFLEKVMQPFFSNKDPGKGTGLGLSISKGIIEDHNGYFYYKRNSPNTCFVIELPRSQTS